jgi:hypothetical protein
MAYTPELTDQYSGILRRIAWAYKMPMTRAIEGLLECSARFIDRKKVCEACRDRSFCDRCLFRKTTEETTQSHTALIPGAPVSSEGGAECRS